MSYSADDAYDVYNETIHKARKVHTCDACAHLISPGHRYVTVFICFDGTAESLKRCGRCQALHLHLRELCSARPYYDRLWPAERLDCGKDYLDEWGSAPPPDIAALAFALPGEVEPRLE